MGSERRSPQRHRAPFAAESAALYRTVTIWNVLTRRNPAFIFAAAASAVLIVCIAIARANINDVATWGVTFDLTITIPLLYYFFIVRTQRATPLSLLAVFMVCAALAKLIVPSSPFLHDLRFIAAPLELVVIGLIVRRMWRREPLLPGVIGAAVAGEVAILQHALFGWRMRRDVPEDTTPFSIHERSGWGTVAACIIVLVTVESIGLHLFLLHYSAKVAWLLTALDLWGILWILGDYHALRLRPILVSDDGLHVRVGLRWDVVVPWSAIESVEAIAPGSEWKRRGVLKVALLDEPRVMLRLRHSVVANGLAGLHKTIDAIAILPDDEAGFADALKSHLG
jgi:hypothetical protein